MISSMKIPLLMFSHHSILHPLSITIHELVTTAEIVETARSGSLQNCHEAETK